MCPPLATWKDIAPPIGYFGAGQESHFQVRLPFNSYGLNGGSDWQFLRPAYAGTWITRQFRILDIFEKPGRSGMLVFVVRQETQTTQLGQVISLAKRVSIHRSPAGTGGGGGIGGPGPTANGSRRAANADTILAKRKPSYKLNDTSRTWRWAMTCLRW